MWSHANANSPYSFSTSRTWSELAASAIMATDTSGRPEGSSSLERLLEDVLNSQISVNVDTQIKMDEVSDENNTSEIVVEFSGWGKKESS